MPTPKYPHNLDGLKQKYAEELQKEVRQNLNYSIGQFEAIARMADIETLIESIKPTEDPLVHKIQLVSTAFTTGLSITAKRVGWFNNQYTFSAGELSYNAFSNIDNGLLQFIKSIYVVPFTECKYRLENYDDTYHFSDDHRSWSAGEASRKRIIELYEKCNDEERAILKSLKKAEHFNFI